MWQDELRRLQDRIESRPNWFDGMPHGTSIGDPTGNLATELANCKMMISCKELEIQIQRNRIIRYIDNIEDSVLRQIVFYRCVSCMGWMEVSSLIGGRTTAESTRKTFNRHFNEGGNNGN